MKTWKGYDYRTGKEIELPRAEWLERIKAARNTTRADGDLLLHGEKNIVVAEVYDREV